MGSGGVVLNICYLGAAGIPGASSVYAKPDALQYSLRHTEEKKEEKKVAETVLPVKQAVTYDEFIKVQTERDTFVRLYRELLEKLIGGKAAV